MKNILIINAHQFYEGFSEGKLNSTMVDIAKETVLASGCEVKLTSIEKGYDINQEVEKHLWADLIITQSPVFWFGAPWIYKKYVDEIFTAGLVQQNLIVDDGRTRKDPAKQYGTGGKMQGKKYMLSLTWNAPEQAFNDSKQFLFEGKSVDDVFISNTANYKFCGADILPSFSCYNVVKDLTIEEDIKHYQQYLKRIISE
jgi:NADPH dehydrogenase (quinone)